MRPVKPTRKCRKSRGWWSVVRELWRAFWKWFFDLFKPRPRRPSSITVHFDKPTEE